MIPRLEELCGVQGAIVHANKSQVKKAFLSACSFDPKVSIDINNSELFGAMEKMVRGTLHKYNLVLRRKISTPIVVWCLIKSYQWASFHEKKFGLPFDYCYYFLSSLFTSKGGVDEEKAAREILKDTNISSSIRFCIACYYCFSDVIPALWEQLPEDKRPKFVNGKVNTDGLGRDVMVDLYSCLLLGKLSLLKKGKSTFSFHKFMCFENDEPHWRVFRNNVSFKNCFEELKKSQRRRAVILTSTELYNTLTRSKPQMEIVIYFLHNLAENELRLFFQNRFMLYLVLHHLLSWPYQHLFLSTVNRFWELLTNWQFVLLLRKIVVKIDDELTRKFYDIYHILKEFWKQSPSSMKTFYFHVEGGYYSFPFGEEDLKFYQFFYKEFEMDQIIVIIDRFTSSLFTDEDEEILRQIFASATMEEKLRIEESKGKVIRDKALRIFDLKRIDLFIECCVPKERVRTFKRKLFDVEDESEDFSELIIYGKLKQLQEIHDWALEGDHDKEYQQKLLNLLLTSGKDILKYNPDNLKTIDQFLGEILSSDEMKVFKERLVLSLDHFAERYKFFPLRGETEMIDFYLNWTHLPKKDCQSFKRRFAFHDNIVEYYCECVSEKQLSRTDEFLLWAELTEAEVRGFKEIIMFNRKIVSWACASLIREGTSEFVEELLDWSQFSEEKIKDFYIILLDDITSMKPKFEDVKNLFSDFPSFEKEDENYKKNFPFKTADVIEYYQMRNEWEKVEEFLNWRFSYRKEIEESKRFYNVEKFSWTGIDIRVKNYY